MGLVASAPTAPFSPATSCAVARLAPIGIALGAHEAAKCEAAPAAAIKPEAAAGGGAQRRAWALGDGHWRAVAGFDVQ